MQHQVLDSNDQQIEDIKKKSVNTAPRSPAWPLCCKNQPWKNGPDKVNVFLFGQGVFAHFRYIRRNYWLAIKMFIIIIIAVLGSAFPFLTRL